MTALANGTQSCCVNGLYVKRVVERLNAAQAQTIACCVVGFPLGAGSAEAKALSVIIYINFSRS